ncbi:hypothetical protein Calkr_0587 [Caldicellulosiruptor acetigenus I77R1B]|uniref:Uncharacterized protein n=1 Tax=Caldicellulosiruptor acetigenus (strain ATCC 700853 / DSM 12137 / I77R1B) TaxID=632335 RepID=E4S9Z1_CALA7|nr:hypothetical protein Calkr_0587 [Caldicellulosiruptor acetigenus I77R1B]
MISYLINGEYALSYKSQERTDVCENRYCPNEN